MLVKENKILLEKILKVNNLILFHIHYKNTFDLIVIPSVQKTTFFVPLRSYKFCWETHIGAKYEIWKQVFSYNFYASKYRKIVLRW